MGLKAVRCWSSGGMKYPLLARIIHELVLRDCEDKLTTGQPQGLESEEYLNSTSQSELVLSHAKEDPRTHGRAFISTVGVANSWIIRANTSRELPIGYSGTWW